ncbi:MAG: DUF2846 domain-containing protein [Gammaproteobacteria bacterium]
MASQLTLVKSINCFILLAVTIALAGCAGTAVDTSHPLIKDATAGPLAHIYFIRPQTERFLGMADNKLAVELDQQHILDIVKGEYALIDIEPGDIWVTTRSSTSWGPRQAVKKMSKSRRFNFEGGNTYFIVIKPVDGEFRGVYYMPESVSLSEAKQVVRGLRATGEAKNTPIKALEG